MEGRAQDEGAHCLCRGCEGHADWCARLARQEEERRTGVRGGAGLTDSRTINRPYCALPPRVRPPRLADLLPASVSHSPVSRNHSVVSVSPFAARGMMPSRYLDKNGRPVFVRARHRTRVPCRLACQQPLQAAPAVEGFALCGGRAATVSGLRRQQAHAGVQPHSPMHARIPHRALQRGDARGDRRVYDGVRSSGLHEEEHGLQEPSGRDQDRPDWVSRADVPPRMLPGAEARLLRLPPDSALHGQAPKVKGARVVLLLLCPCGLVRAPRPRHNACATTKRLKQKPTCFPSPPLSAVLLRPLAAASTYLSRSAHSSSHRCSLGADPSNTSLPPPRRSSSPSLRRSCTQSWTGRSCRRAWAGRRRRTTERRRSSTSWRGGCRRAAGRRSRHHGAAVEERHRQRRWHSKNRRLPTSMQAGQLTLRQFETELVGA